jgi:hypothetical protein
MAPSRSQLDRVLRRAPSISILAKENEGPVFAGASDDPSIPATSMASLSLLPRTAAPLLSGAWAERVAFSPLAWS